MEVTVIRKQEIVTILGKQYIMPESIRTIDVNKLDCIDGDILLDLSMHGRRGRWYYRARGNMDRVLRLKSKGFVVSVKKDGRYAYDLSHGGYWVLEHGLV